MVNKALPYRPCVGVCLIKDGLVFAAKRIDMPSEAWQMPQGGIDQGEAVRDAALRELGEETSVPAHKIEILAETPYWLNYELPPELVGKIWGGRYRGQRQKWYAMRFDGEDSLINIETEHPEFSEWRWMHPDDVIANIVPFKKEIYRQVLGAFSDVLG